MKKQILILFSLLLIFLLPTLAQAGTTDFNWIYFHYENSKFVEQYSKLESISDVFQTYFTFEKYISIVILAYTIVALILAWDVIRGKRDLMIFWEKFFYKSMGDNIVVKTAIIIVGYFLFLFPVPVVQVVPIVGVKLVSSTGGGSGSSSTSTTPKLGEMEVKGWTIDKTNSMLDSSGKLLHVPMIIGIPLGLLERYVYGFPVNGLSDSSKLQMDWDSSTKRHKLTNVDDSISFEGITASHCPISENKITQAKLTECDNFFNSSNLKPNSFSILGNTSTESAEIFVNVAAPFKKIENLIRFQSSFLNSIQAEESAELTTDKIVKNQKILEEYMNTTHASEKYIKSIKELYQERVKKINILLSREYERLGTIAPKMTGYKHMGGFLRAYKDAVTLTPMARIYTTEITTGKTANDVRADMENGVIDFKITKGGTGDNVVITALKQRNHLVQSEAGQPPQYQPTGGKNRNLLNLSATISNSIPEYNNDTGSVVDTGEYINNRSFDKMTTSSCSNGISFDKSPFIFDSSTNFKIKFSIAEMSDNGASTKKSNLLCEFWENYKTNIFDKLKSITDAQSSKLSYYKPDLLKKVLINLGIKENDLDLNKVAENLSKYDKLTLNLFVLDALYAYLEKKSYEANFAFFDLFEENSWEKIQKMSKSSFIKKYGIKLNQKLETWKDNKKMIMGLIFDDYSFLNSEKSNAKKTNNILLIRVGADDIAYTEVDNRYTPMGKLYQYKNTNNSILQFLCEDSSATTDADVNEKGMCVLKIESSDIILNTQTLSILNSNQSNLFNEIISSMQRTPTGIEKYKESVKTETKNVINPCNRDQRSLSCAKFVAQEKLKTKTSAMLSSITDSNVNSTSLTLNGVEAIEYIYAGLLRKVHDEISTELHSSDSKYFDANPYSPFCYTHWTSEDTVKVSGAEAYNNIKESLSNAINASNNYVGNQIILIASTLEALNHNQLEIGESGWSGTGSSSDPDPKLKLSSPFVGKIQEAMGKAITDAGGTTSGTTCNPASQPTSKTEARALCKMLKGFTQVSTASPNENTLRLQINYMARFLAINSANTPIDSSLLIKAFKAYADSIGSFYNRAIVVSNTDTFAGISKITGIFSLLFGGNFTYDDSYSYDFGFTDKSDYLEELTIPSRICSSPSLKEEYQEISKNIISENMDKASAYIDSMGLDSGDYMNSILSAGLMFILVAYCFLALMLPFLYILVFSLIATAVGWFGAISLGYITVLNILVLKNFDDIDFINNHWKTPSKKMTVYFMKAILSSMLLYVYLVSTVFLINGILIPLANKMTMYYIITALVSSDGMSLPTGFDTVTFVIVTIYLVYMKYTIRIVKDWFSKEVISPAKVAMEHAEQFAKKLNK